MQTDLKKELEKVDKNIQKYSRKLRKADESNSTLMERANLKLKLNEACFRKYKMLELLEKRKKGIIIHICVSGTGFILTYLIW